MKPLMKLFGVLAVSVAVLPGCLYVSADGEILRDIAEDRDEGLADLQRDIRDLRRRVLALEHKTGITDPKGQEWRGDHGEQTDEKSEESPDDEDEATEKHDA